MTVAEGGMEAIGAFAILRILIKGPPLAMPSLQAMDQLTVIYYFQKFGIAALPPTFDALANVWRTMCDLLVAIVNWRVRRRFT
jgi:hypothetical protein